MDHRTAEHFLLDQIPIRVQRLLPPKLKLAYQAANEIIQATPALQVPTALDDRGRIISWTVDFTLKVMIESGEWPKADLRWEMYARPTGCYLEVRLPHSTLSISKVQFWKDQPRNVLYRQNARLGNAQISLPGFEDEDGEEATGCPSFLLVHGNKNLEFAHIGIPHRFHEHGYICQTPNLMRMLHEVPASDLPPAEPQPNIDELLTLKAEIERWQRDNGER